ncbi:MAG: hypothetical protein FJ121_03380 [Deltaproteobacteria bacterium]|nr:hypothetical protein [Deltaproteobacteria bacterium]
MPTEIVVVVENMRLNGYLGDSPTAQALADALPIEGRAQLWGEEISGNLPNRLSWAFSCVHIGQKRQGHTGPRLGLSYQLSRVNPF